MAGIEQGSLLTVGVEAHQVHACLVESVGPAYRLAGWSTVQNDEFFIVGQQVSRACRQLGERLGRVLWDDDQDTPVYQSQDAVRYPPLQYVSAAATSRPRLRVWLAGLSSTISMAAARQALRSSPIQIVGTTHLEADLDGSDLADELIDGQPDVMVIVGGYDTSTAAIQEPLITLCRVIGLALQRMPPGQHPTIFYAGNHQMAGHVYQLLSKVSDRIQVQVLENIQPTPDLLRQAGIAHAMTHYHWQLCQRMSGFTKLADWITSPAQITSMDWSFAQLVQSWRIYQNLPELHGLYCSKDWWLHVWASQSQGELHLAYVDANTRPNQMHDWPPLGLVSGQPSKSPWNLWAAPSVAWWDHSGMAPVVAPLAQISPQAMIQVLGYDLLERQAIR